MDLSHYGSKRPFNLRGMHCRALMVQRFLHDIRKDTQKRAEKTKQALAASEGKHKKLSKEQADAFFQRLQSDGERRKKAR